MTPEGGADVTELAAKVKQLVRTVLTIIDVMATAIDRRVQPLRLRPHPLCAYNGTEDCSRSIRQSFFDQAAFGTVMAGIYQGTAEDFARRQFRDGLSYYNPADIVSPPAPLLCLPELF
jgi:hypothetical protein